MINIEDKKLNARKNNRRLLSKRKIIWYLLIIIIIYRIIAAFFVAQSGQAQQYFNYIQSAHKFAYGYGGLNWQMSLDVPLRPYFFLVFASFPYAILKIFNIDDIVFIRYAPKAFAVITSVIFDYFLLKLNSIYNPGTQKLLLFLFYMEFAVFQQFGYVHSNNFESLLCLIAFYLWKTKQTNKYYDFVSRFLVVIGFMCRLSIIMVWGIIWPYELLTMKGTIIDKIKFILKNILTIVAMISGSILFSYLYQGKWKLVEYEFMKFNFEKNVSFFYGASSHFYLLWEIQDKFYLAHLFLLGCGIFAIFKNNLWKFTKEKQFALIYFVFPFLVISSSVHKQFRFLLILFPSIFILITKGFTSIPKKFNKFKYIGIFSVLLHNYIRLQGLLGFQAYINKFGPLIFLAQRQSVKSLMVLIEGYQIPLYSGIHKNIDAIYQMPNPLNYTSETGTASYQNSNELFRLLYKHFQSEEPPTHVLTFQKLANMKRTWNTNNYELIATPGPYLIYQRKI